MALDTMIAAAQERARERSAAYEAQQAEKRQRKADRTQERFTTVFGQDLFDALDGTVAPGDEGGVHLTYRDRPYVIYPRGLESVRFFRLIRLDHRNDDDERPRPSAEITEDRNATRHGGDANRDELLLALVELDAQPEARPLATPQAAPTPPPPSVHDQVAEKIAVARAHLDCADRIDMRTGPYTTAIGHLIIAVSTLADACEQIELAANQ